MSLDYLGDIGFYFFLKEKVKQKQLSCAPSAVLIRDFVPGLVTAEGDRIEQNFADFRNRRIRI